MVGTLLDEEAKAIRPQSGTAKDRSEFADIVDHAAVLVCSAGFGRTGGEKNSLGPALDLSALADHLAV